MRNLLMVLMVFLLGGPVLANESIPADRALMNADSGAAIDTAKKIGKKELTNIDLIYVGMTMDEVEKVMGEVLTIGYKNGMDSGDGGFTPVNLENPHRKEVINKQGKDYTVYYYYTHIKQGDGLIAEEELTPIVFEVGKVIAKGWDALFKIKNL